MILVDSHCHLDRLDLTAYQGSLTLALTAAKAQGVKHFLCVAIDSLNSQTTIDLAAKYDCVSASVGVHPNEEEAQDLSQEQLISLAGHSSVVAVGETGLDYYRQKGDIEWQRERFRRHIRGAREVNKPIIVHSRQAREDTLRILREEKASEVGGVLHCFTENLEMALQAIELNFLISFSGIVTFKNALDLQEIAKQLPRDKILIETDSPYLAPVPYRGKSNEPAFVRYVAEAIAQLRGDSLENVAEYTTRNFFELFKHANRSAYDREFAI